jgi:hypothetical protein
LASQCQWQWNDNQSQIRFQTWALPCHTIPMTMKWWNDEINELMMWKLSFIWMKILNDVAQKCNWIQIQFNLDWIQINLNSIDSIFKNIRVKFNSIQI